MSTQKIKQHVYIPEVLDNLQKITARMGAAVVVLKSKRITIGQFTFSYNVQRPHQTLDYMPPINFIFKYHHVLPMYQSSTNSGQNRGQ